MMTEVEIEKKFNKIIDSKELKSLESISIFELTKNNYIVFGKYIVKKISKSNIEVYLINNDLVYNFSNMKNAICWCIFDLRGRYLDANRIITLDRSITSEQIQIEIHERLFKKSKTTEEKLIFLAKLNEEKLKRTEMNNELLSYINESDYWQQRKFKLKTES